MSPSNKIYVFGNALTPQRFWEYALFTDDSKDGLMTNYILDKFVFSQKNTDLYNSWPDEKKRLARFSYINGEKTTRKK